MFSQLHQFVPFPSSLIEAGFCAREFNTTPKLWIKKMEAPGARVFYNWQCETHQTRIKGPSVLHSYWCCLKIFNEYLNKRGIESFMAEDILDMSLRALRSTGADLPRFRTRKEEWDGTPKVPKPHAWTASSIADWTIPTEPKWWHSIGQNWHFSVHIRYIPARGSGII
ncbi:hypothetical protein CIHG_06220 [Coccidioides immitis H538.4]|uniref:Uncharacterized protein n=3 Tax=Coccidioides immitis TaxID=5501 RepID=A0A0J8QWP4_COCIT|nr:hypothetical protein CIRG_00154 [Coccidioides immitis RMSCC 2394]KMU75763.1 hypothetical protein CISG_05160 [Coccidioides immitis RMSCC 3703]KMU88420.1 hypothetical protein CIHG_06220 [Coccidioides immitis H538.4]